MTEFLRNCPPKSATTSHNPTELNQTQRITPTNHPHQPSILSLGTMFLAVAIGIGCELPSSVPSPADSKLQPKMVASSSSEPPNDTFHPHNPQENLPIFPQNEFGHPLARGSAPRFCRSSIIYVFLHVHQPAVFRSRRTKRIFG